MNVIVYEPEDSFFVIQNSLPTFLLMNNQDNVSHMLTFLSVISKIMILTVQKVHEDCFKAMKASVFQSKNKVSIFSKIGTIWYWRKTSSKLTINIRTACCILQMVGTVVHFRFCSFRQAYNLYWGMWKCYGCIIFLKIRKIQGLFKTRRF